MNETRMLLSTIKMLGNEKYTADDTPNKRKIV